MAQLSRKDGKRPGNWKRSQDRNRIDGERWRAIRWLVQDAEKYLPYYERQGDMAKVMTAQTIIDTFGPIVREIDLTVHPDRLGAHPWSRSAWARLLAITQRAFRPANRR